MKSIKFLIGFILVLGCAFLLAPTSSADVGPKPTLKVTITHKINSDISV